MYAIKKISKNLFSEIFKKGKKIKKEYFLVIYKNNQDEKTGLAVSVSKKVEKKACSRNLYKRRLKFLIRDSNIDFKNKDAIFIIQKKILKKDLPLIEEDLKKIF